MDERATDKAEAWQKNCMAILGNGEIAVCIKPGPWHGWLFEKHPDGQWVSVEKLQTGPMTPEGHPLATLSAIPAAQGERAGLTAEERRYAERMRKWIAEGPRSLGSEHFGRLLVIIDRLTGAKP